MIISAVVDRIEEGNAVLISGEIGMEIRIPVENIGEKVECGEVLYLTLGSENKFLSYKNEVKYGAR